MDARTLSWRTEPTCSSEVQEAVDQLSASVVFADIGTVELRRNRVIAIPYRRRDQPMVIREAAILRGLTMLEFELKHGGPLKHFRWWWKFSFNKDFRRDCIEVAIATEINHIPQRARNQKMFAEYLQEISHHYDDVVSVSRAAAFLHAFFVERGIIR